jgi:outer membrane protein OmpA-like peptidoglycan-associated protein
MLLAGPPVAMASSSAPPAPGGVIVGSGPDPSAATSFAVQDLVFTVQDLVFTQASLDGAVTDIGSKDFDLSADVLFAFDKADLTPRATKELTRIAGVYREQDDVRLITVTGYTDAQGSDAYNRTLSRSRATAVQKQLTRLLGSRVTVRAVGKGEADPVADNGTKAGQAKNRRVEIRGS